MTRLFTKWNMKINTCQSNYNFNIEPNKKVAATAVRNDKITKASF